MNKNIKNKGGRRYGGLFSAVLIIGVLLLFAVTKTTIRANASPNDITPSANFFDKGNTALATTPIMGWNSWNWFGKKNVNEKVIREVIDAIHNSGLQDAGYNYVVVDGGWRDTKLGPKGELLAHPEKFPHGIKALATYAHSKGLKLGVHAVPGTNDCIGDKVGGYGHEEVQLKQFIEWGVDFVKLDLCRFSGGWNEKLIKDTYSKWERLIRNSGADIILSISAYKFREWYPQVGQMARTTEDISAIVGGMSGCTAVFDDVIPTKKNSWGLLTVMQIAEENNKWARYAGNGYWNDPDMVVTGAQGLSEEEQKSHFALWCIMSAPLILGNDPRHMTQAEKDIILNKDCIMVDQDTTEQGKRIKKHAKTEIWAKHLTNDKVAVMLLNRDKQNAQNITLNFSDINVKGAARIKDIYSKKELGQFTGSFTRKINSRAGFFIIIDSNN